MTNKPDMPDTSDRIKQLMTQVGFPDSQSMYVAFHQLANELEQSHQAAISELEDKHKAEMLGELKIAAKAIGGLVASKYTENDLIFRSDAIKVINSIKARIGGEHE
jgi:hypothetical protein